MMFNNDKNEDQTYRKLEPKKGVSIETIYNEEMDVYEVTMDDTLMGTYPTQEEAAKDVEKIYLSFETGYVNGLLLGFMDKEKAKEALKDRGVEFITEFNFED